MRAALALAAALLTAGCGGAERSGDPAPRAVEAAGSDRPSRLALAGSSGCTDCHEPQARAHASSAHARSARVIGSGPEAPFAEGAPLSEGAESLGRPEPPASQQAPDASGFEAERAAGHALGLRRRVDYLHDTGEGLQALPLSWSLTKAEWVDRETEEGGAPEPGSWTRPASSWERACAGCHPLAGSAAGAESPLADRTTVGDEPGIGCETCHGPGALHAALARQGEAPSALRESIVRAAPDAFDGCAHCHARGEELPLIEAGAMRAAQPIGALRLFESAIGAGGPHPRYFADGRPGDAHGRAALSLEQSACFQEGGATCATCHDPHSGGLRDEDPDAGCRGCHAEQAAAGRSHSGHPAPTAPVPRAAAEPAGPSGGRAPGCVDCHAPAVLGFGSHDRARDHAFGLPEPELARDFGVPDACTACHADRPVNELIAWLTGRHPDRRADRHARATAYRRALALSAAGQARLAADAVEPLAALLSDESRGLGPRASAAHALGALGPVAGASAEALSRAAGDDAAVVAQAALFAWPSVGGADGPRLVRLARTADDWRVRLAAAAALDRLGDAEGAAELGVLAAQEDLPTRARARARMQLGLAFMRRGQLQRAAFQLEEAIGLDRELVPAWLNLGVARVGLDDPEGARLAWQTVLALAPGDPVARANLARLGAR